MSEAVKLSRCGDIVEWSPDKRFGRFPRKKGEGATKTVYEACDLREGTLVAWSEISTALLSSDERARVNAEASLLSQVDHVNIIKFFGTWSDETKVVLVTALVESGDLLHFYRVHQNVKLKIIKRWCRQIIAGIRYLHSFEPPIIHRDLKCENILFNAADGNLKLADFGLSTRVVDQGTCATVSVLPDTPGLWHTSSPPSFHD
jgi:WNK lysine deficient protein kinase